MQHTNILDKVEFNLFDNESIEGRLTRFGDDVTWGRRLKACFDGEVETDETPILQVPPLRHDNDCPGSPVPLPRPDLEEHARDPHLGRVVVTPDFKPKAVTNAITTGTVELQMEYLRTLKKLAKLMRRSDETRAIVKKQRTSHYGDGNFFASTRWGELEQTRHKVARLIQHESTIVV